MPLFTPPVFANSGGITTTKALTPTAPATVSPGRALYDAKAELLKRKRALVDASDPSNPTRAANNATGRNVIELYNPANPLRAASTNAKRALIDATGRQSQQQRGYYDAMGNIIGQRTAETGQLQAATHDVADLTAVAQAQGHRNAINALRDSVGIARPIEINTPTSGVTGLPVGVAAALRPNAEYIADNIKDKEAVRGNTLAALRNTLDIGQLDVGDVRRMGDVADLNLEQGMQGATYLDKLSGQDLQDMLDQLGFERDVAGSDLAQQQLGEYGKELYVDPYTGESRYVTPAEKDELDYQYRFALEAARYPRELQRSDTRALERIPQERKVAQTRQQYNTQQDAGGSQLAAYDTADFVNLLANSATSGDSSEANPALAAIRAELIRRLVLKGIPPNVAENTAVQQLQQYIAAAAALKKREDKAAGGGGGGPTVTVQVP